MWQNCSEAQRIVTILGPRTGRKAAELHYMEKATGGESNVRSSLISSVQACIEVTTISYVKPLLWEGNETGVKLAIFLQN